MGELAQVTHGSKHGPLIASQMMDVTIRVESIRSFSVSQMSLLLQNHHLLMVGGHGGRGGSCSTDVLYAASWICGEFAQKLESPHTTLKAMCKRTKVMMLPGYVQATYIQNVMKLYAHVVSAETSRLGQGESEAGDTDFQGESKREGEVAEVTEALTDALKSLTSSSDLEVQERATVMQQYVKYVGKHLSRTTTDQPALNPQHLEIFFAGELNPVAPKAQRKVPVPEGLDLDTWINEPPPDDPESDPESSGDEDATAVFVKTELKLSKGHFLQSPKEKKRREPSEEEVRKYREARIQQQQSDPNYLKGGTVRKSSLDMESIPIRKLSDMTGSGVPQLLIPGLASADQYFDPAQGSKRSKKKKKDGKKSKKHHKRSDGEGEEKEEEEEPAPAPVVSVLKCAEMPEGAELSDGDSNESVNGEEAESHRALRDISLTDTDNIRDLGKPVANGSSGKVDISSGDQSKKKRHKKKEKKHKSKRQEDPPVNQQHNNPAQVIPDTDDVNFWLGKDESSSDQAASNSKPSTALNHIFDSQTTNGVSAGAATETADCPKKGRKVLLETDSFRLSCDVSVCPDSAVTDSDQLGIGRFGSDLGSSAEAQLTFVLESRSSSKQLSNVKIQLGNSKHTTVIKSSQAGNEVKLTRKGERTYVNYTIQVSSDYVKSTMDGEISFDLHKGSSKKEKTESFGLTLTNLDLVRPLEESALGDLLSRGVLHASMSKKKTLHEMRKFRHVMKAVNCGSGFAAAEECGDSAYLGGLFLGRHPVALLLKFTSSGDDGAKLAVDGKAADQDTLSKVMKDFSDILS